MDYLHRLGLAWIAWGVLLVGLLCATGASAQTVTLPDSNWEREDPRTDTPFPREINYADCISDNAILLSPTLMDHNGDLQVWAGGPDLDCTVPEARPAGDSRDAGDCWLVLSEDIETRNPTLLLSPQDVASQRGPGTGTVEDCDTANFGSDGTTVTFYVMFLAGGAVQGTHATWQSGIDLVGPSPPTGVDAAAGEERVILEWTPPEVETTGFRFFCDPPRGSTIPAGPSATGGTGTASAAGGMAGAPPTGTGGSAPSSRCSSNVLIEGERPDAAYLCGEERSMTASEGEATGLVNDVGYTVGIASVDRIGNVGPLSSVVCTTPKDVIDFFETYRESGGQGGGGFCSIGAAGAPQLGGWMLLGALVWWRRRRGKVQ